MADVSTLESLLWKFQGLTYHSKHTADSRRNVKGPKRLAKEGMQEI